MKKSPLFHRRVFDDPEFVRRYAREQLKFAKPVNSSLIENLKKVGFKGGKILEAGCGPGYQALALKEAFPDSRVTGIDLSEMMLEVARKDAADKGITQGLEYFKADVENIPYDDNSFDAVVNLFVFHIVKDPVRMCNEFERVLKPGGHFVIIDLRRKPWLVLFEREIKAAYTKKEARDVIALSRLKPAAMKGNILYWTSMA